MTRYEHTQIGHVIVWSLLAIILIASGGLLGSSAHRGLPVVVSIILLVCLVLFYKLRITIEDETLCASFGPGIIRKRVRLVEIVGCEPIRIRWWYGWGIHLTPCGWLYNVSGFEAVAITLTRWQKIRASALMILTGSTHGNPELGFRKCTRALATAVGGTSVARWKFGHR